MIEKDFFKRVVKDKKDLLQEFLDLLHRHRIHFCIIGGLAVNAYAEPVVSLDLDVVVIARRLKELFVLLSKKYKTKKYANSMNIFSPASDLRIQLQTDLRYQEFIGRSAKKQVLGYKLPVASIEDVLRGKIWAVEDATRRPSKRQKDLADIMRLVESKKSLLSLLPVSLKNKLGIKERKIK
jgi:hypothetical protein